VVKSIKILPSFLQLGFIKLLNSRADLSTATRKKYIEKESALLRQILRACPNWIKGHLLLARNELLLLELAEGNRDPRSIATVRVSAQAVLQLTNKENPTHEAFRREASGLMTVSEGIEKLAPIKLEPLETPGQL